MKKTTVPFKEVGMLSRMMHDYLDQKDSLQPFYQYAMELDSFEKAIEQRKEINRDLLVESLNDQYKKMDLSTDSLVQKNIDVLKSESTFTITTGHQLNLFTGPLFFIYKILNAINLSESLKIKFPNKNFVPVFWMATEDHDFEEINHAFVFGRKIEWTSGQSGGVGRMTIEKMRDALNEVIEMLGDSEKGIALGTVLNEIFDSSECLAEFTRKLVHTLFQKYGVVIVDGDHSLLKSAFVKIAKKELFEFKGVGEIEKTSLQLKEDGYHVQVTPREINLFFLENGIRERIIKEGDNYLINNTDRSLSKEELEEILNNSPEKISPNAVYRPLYQETILPNLAYVGGGGEIAYWLQLKDLFAFHNTSFPILILRNSVLLIEADVKKKMDKLKVDWQDLLLREEQLIQGYVKENTTEELSIEKEIGDLEQLFLKLGEKAAQIDPTLDQAVKGELARQIKGLEGLGKRMERAEKKKHEQAINQLKKLRNKLMPDGHLQERHDNFIPLWFKYGVEVIDEIKKSLNPIENELVVLELR